MFGLNAITVMFCLYIFIMLSIGFIAYLKTTTFSDYILGGRSIGSFVTAMSAGASDMSGWLLMGLPGAIYASGLMEGWIAVGLTIGAWLNWRFVAGRLRVQTEFHKNALTLPDYFNQRFEDKSKALKVISASIILFFFTIYCASGVVAGARLFEKLFEVSYANALWFGALATIAYTFIGGFLAVSWTDTVQASLMIFALILTPIAIIFAVGGIDQSAVLIQAKDVSINYLDMFSNATFIGTISLLAWGLGYCGQPHILARFMAASSVATLKKARRISIIWMIICLLGAVAVGLLGIAYFGKYPDLAAGVSAQNERVFIELASLLFNPWVAGILLSAIFAAVMSTLSCQLLVCSSAITEDFYKSFLRNNASQKELVWVGRFMVLLIAIVAILIAQDPESSVLALVSNAWAGFGASFGPVILFSLYWSGMTRNGALAGMVTGALFVIFWDKIAPIEGLYEIIPGFIGASIMIIVFSLLDKSPSTTQKERFAEANNVYLDEMNKI